MGALLILALWQQLFTQPTTTVQLETTPSREELVVSWPSTYPCMTSLVLHKVGNFSYADCPSPGYVDVYTKAGVVRVFRETGEVKRFTSTVDAMKEQR